MPPRYVLIANPGSKRCELYRRELFAYWACRGPEPDVAVVPWADVVPRDGCLDGLAAFDRSAVVRLESPGKDDGVARLLLEAGARDDPAEPPRDWPSLALPPGLLVRPGLWYRGFRRVLEGLKRSFDARPHLRPTACPLAVAAMFDKRETCQLLAEADVPMPELMPGPPEMPEVIHDAALILGWPTAYVKLNTGASAMGIVVLHPNREGRPAFGITSLAADGDEFYNTRLLRRVVANELFQAIAFILNEGAIVQRGVPMAQVDGENFDVRVVCVYGSPSAAIFRLSPNPMTNLHLGGRRGDPDRCRAAIPARSWLDGLEACSTAAGCFRSAVAGVDLLFERGSWRPHVLEVNAFGDFFPGWVDGSGRSIHALEIAATASR